MFEEEHNIEDYNIVAGVDEVGRGCLAGPVYAAAVVLPKDFSNEFGIDDSKKITEKKREELFEIVKTKSIDYALGFCDNLVVDEINILQATQKAMHKAINSLINKPDFLLIDGNYFNSIGIPYKTIIKGDSKELAISAASILAKVTRDHWMIEVADKKYPEYHFAENKGYGTKKHLEALEKYGPCEIHRQTFLKKFNSRQLELF